MHQKSDVETKLYFLQTRYYDAETGRFISPDSIEYLDPECINGLNLYCYCYNNPLMMLDLNGKFPVGALIFGAIFSFALSYGEDVYKNLSDGFDLSDFNTFDGNEFKYICAAIGGALSGVLGAYDKIYLSFIGDFVGNMVENAYTFSDWKNVRKTIWTSLIAGSVSGISTAISNRLTKLYLDNKVVNSSNEVQKEMKKFMKKIQNSNSNTLVKLPSNTLVGELINNTLKYKKVVSKIFSFFNISLGFYY